MTLSASVVPNELILFFALAVLALLSALGMLLSRNAVYAALLLIVNFIVVAIFYLMLEAPFIAIAQVTVYAGAIMVLFIFVIMLLGAERAGQTRARWWWQPTALVLGIVLVAEAVYLVLRELRTPAAAAELPPAFGSPLEIGQVLFSQYMLPFEATSILLLIAMIGAIVMTRNEKKS